MTNENQIKISDTDVAEKIKAELAEKMAFLQIVREKYENEANQLRQQITNIQDKLLKERNDALRRLSLAQKERDEYLNSIRDASLLLYDWDGYYDPETGKGDTIRLAELVEQAYKILQGESWRAGDGKS